MRIILDFICEAFKLLVKWLVIAVALVIALIVVLVILGIVYIPWFPFPGGK